MGLVTTINGNQSKDEVFQGVKEALGDYLPDKKKKKKGPNCLRKDEFFVLVDNSGNHKVVQASEKKI